ncbi:MAG: AraC family transcriptional regulator [Clostridia bacterium]
MTIRELAEAFQLRIFTDETTLEQEISGGYACDLLSWVMSHLQTGDIWITVHAHLNVIAVAVLTEAVAILLPEGIEPAANVVAKANEEKIAILGSSSSSFTLCNQIAQLLAKRGE